MPLLEPVKGEVGVGVLMGGRVRSRPVSLSIGTEVSCHLNDAHVGGRTERIR
jgi:hypothetical protein